MKKRNFAILFLIVLVTFGTVILSTRQGAQQKPQGKDEPTVVRKGIMTEKQRRHSKEFENREIPGIRTRKEETVGVYIDIEPRPLPDNAKATNSGEYLRALTCASITNAVIVGKIASKASQLTANSRFVFTDYDVEIVDVLKGPVGDDSTFDKVVTITDAGGAVKVDGRTIFADISREYPLRVGQTYVLFLKGLTDSGSYRLIGERGIFAVFQEDIKPTHYSFPERFTYRDLVEQIRTTAHTCVEKNGRGQ